MKPSIHLSRTVFFPSLRSKTHRRSCAVACLFGGSEKIALAACKLFVPSTASVPFFAAPYRRRSGRPVSSDVTLRRSAFVGGRDLVRRPPRTLRLRKSPPRSGFSRVEKRGQDSNYFSELENRRSIEGETGRGRARKREGIHPEAGPFRVSSHTRDRESSYRCDFSRVLVRE